MIRNLSEYFKPELEIFLDTVSYKRIEKLNNNCEHFANVCTLGRFRSHQVERLLQNKGVDYMGIFSTIGGFIKGIFGGSSS